MAVRASCVSSSDELNDALDEARSGDVIKICDGDYTGFYFNMETKGVTVEAVTHGTVEIHGGSYMEMHGSGNTFAGVEYHGGGSTKPINMRGEGNTIYNCVINHHDAEKWVEIKGKNNVVRNCRFSEKTNHSGGKQQLLDIRSLDDLTHNKVLNNVFRNNEFDADTPYGENEHETIRIYVEESNHEGHHTVEGNYFNNCIVEIEVVSVKARYTTVKNNAFEDNKGTLTFRSDDDNLAEG